MDRAALDQEALAASYAGAAREVAATPVVDRRAGHSLERCPGGRGGPRPRREVEGYRPQDCRRAQWSRMSDRATLAVRFLTSMAQALTTISLYAEGHPARARAAVPS